MVCLSFLWGKERACVADDLTGTDQKIPDNSRRRLTLQVSQVSRPGSVPWASAQWLHFWPVV